MKTILHIGMSKTGSTALQNALRDSPDYLAARGLLYPKNPPGVRFNNHRLLAAQIMPFEALPRHMKGRHGVTAATIDASLAAFVAQVAEQVAAARPAGLILSTETLFRRMTPAAGAALREACRRMGAAAPRIAVYLRRPSEHYLALLLQVLTATATVRPPRPTAYRAALESYSAAFGADAVTPRLYHRAHLAQGDLIADFFATHLPEFEVDPARLDATSRRNTTLSGESTDLVARYRQAFHAERDNLYTRDTADLRDALAVVEAATGAPRPRLRPQVADMVDYASPDALWLRRRHGVIFPGLDYDRLAAKDAPAPARFGRLDALIEIDRAAQARIVEGLAETPWAAAAPDRAAWIDALRAPGGLDLDPDPPLEAPAAALA